jgi:hypothetical protein
MNNVSGTKPYHRRTMLALPPLSNAIRETEAPGGFQALGDNRGFELPGEPAATLGLQVGHQTSRDSKKSQTYITSVNQGVNSAFPPKSQR